MNQLSTAVVLVIFNRPKTTQSVFKAISLARPKRLYIVGDGPRGDRSLEKGLVDQCRQIVSNVDWPCEVFTKYSDTNLGCRENVVQGLDWVFTKEEELIILEDDCVPTPDFFEFCQEMLGRFRGEAGVGSVCGSNLEEVSSLAPNLSYWFSRYPRVWGWATWKRVWQEYESDLSQFSRAERDALIQKNVGTRAGSRYWGAKFESVASGKVDTWDYQLTFLHFRNSLVSVIPRVNLISNIGFGPDATHTVARPKESLRLGTGQLTWPVYGPSVAEPFEDFDEIVERNRFRLSQFRRVIDFVYSLSPRWLQNLMRQVVAYFSTNNLRMNEKI